jgi:hypothetical protein
MKNFIFPTILIGLSLASLIFIENKEIDHNSRSLSYNYHSNNSSLLQDDHGEGLSFVNIQDNSSHQNYNIIFITNEDMILSIGKENAVHNDNPRDNEIRFEILEEISSDYILYLEYDLYGLANCHSVVRSVNEYLSYGGQIITRNEQWSRQTEIISTKQINKGLNIIRFSTPENIDIHYKIKNISLRIEKEEKHSNGLIIQQNISGINYGHFVYINGFLEGTSDRNVRIYANDHELRSIKGMFEGVVPMLQGENSVLVSAVFDNGNIISETVELKGVSEYDYLNFTSNDIAHIEQYVLPENDFNLNLNAFSLHAVAGFVSNSIHLSVTGLRETDIPLLSPSMINVTAEHAAYRCLPHGSVFEKDVLLKIKYDVNSIPSGYGPEDIRTFYYDELISSWVMLEFDSLDVENNSIISKTNHFTDFINAILKTPESPQTQAFTPTSLKDMAYANPMAGVNVIQPPVANNSGTANLSFPLNIPTGRNGMQPQLAISYSSDAGNDWLGVGWNLQLPAITVETRWGVPLYSQDHETESYLVNGEQIIELDITPNDTTRLPLIHMETYRPRGSSDTTYYSYRIEGAFHRIIRHGSNPSDYWWEVIDKQGTRYFYGKYSNSTVANSNCIMQATNNGIAHWALAEVRDIYGNYIKYEYEPIYNFNSPGYGGYKLYPTKIIYTGHDTTDGLYTIDFELIDKSDYTISGRYGFLEVTTKLLSNIIIKYDNQFIRKYYLEYEEGAYKKSVLRFIADITAENFNTNSINNYCENEIFEYHPNVLIHCFEYDTEEGLQFGNSVDFLNSINIGDNIFDGLYNDSRPSIGRSKGTSGSLGASVCFGLGSNVFTKNNSLGINLGSSLGTTKEKIQLIDLNGDGILDLVVNNPNGLDFNEGYLGNNKELLFSNTSVTLPSINLGQSKHLSFNVGAELSFNIMLFKGALSYSFNNNTQKSNRFFSDINGDGFLDFYNDGDVYFNFPSANGTPNFTMHGMDSVVIFPDDTCYSIIYNGTIDSVFIENNSTTHYKRDPVRMWIADQNDKIIIKHKIQRITSPNQTAKTLYYSIQKNGIVIYCDSILPGDTIVQDTLLCTSVNKNDELFFRIHSNENSLSDEVYWDMEILSSIIDSCTVIPNMHDADEKPINRFKYSLDAVIHDNQFFIAPFTGKVMLSANLNSPDQSDTLRYVVKHNSNTLINQVYPFAIQFSHTYLDSIIVNEGDTISLTLNSNTNVNWNDISFDCLIQYFFVNGNPIDTTIPYYSVKFFPSIQMGLYPKIIQRSVPAFNLNGTNVSVYPQISISGNPSGKIIMTAKSNRNLLDKKELSVINGIVFGGPLVFSTTGYDTIFIDYFCRDITLCNSITNAGAFFNDQNGGYVGIRCGLFSMFPDDMKRFGNLFRGWGQFSYYDNQANINCSNIGAIDVSKLNIDFSVIDTTQLDSTMLNDMYDNLADWSLDSLTNSFDDLFSTLGMPDAYSLAFMPMIANRKDNKWADLFNTAYSASDKAGSLSFLSNLISEILNSSVFEADDFPFS